MNVLTSTTERQAHWNRIYTLKKEDQVSWYEPIPLTSLELIKSLNLPKSASITDSGAGESHLVDHLLDMGYHNITLLDISEVALSKTRERLGNRAGSVKWIATDLLECEQEAHVDLWHDRAAFHFLVDQEDIARYVETVKYCVKPGGYLIMATFSDKGPKTCSGLNVTQYTDESLSRLFSPEFEKVRCFTVDHHTPSDTTQNFLFCLYRRLDLSNGRRSQSGEAR